MDTNTDMTMDVGVAILQAILANALSVIFMNDKSLLERTMNNHTHFQATQRSVNSNNSGSGDGDVDMEMEMVGSSGVSSSTAAGTGANKNTNKNTNTSSNAGVKKVVRDAKTLLAKSVLTVILSTIDSLKTFTSIDISTFASGSGTRTGTGSACVYNGTSNTSTNNNNKNLTKEVVRHKFRGSIWKNLSTLERILAIPKRKSGLGSASGFGSTIPSSLGSASTGVGVGSMSTSTTSILSGGGSGGIGGGGTGGGTTTSAGTLHIPMTSQHAHSISMSSQNGAEWSHLVHLVDGSEGAGSGASASGSDGDKEGTREFDLEDYALECLHVYHLITGKNEEEREKEEDERHHQDRKENLKVSAEEISSLSPLMSSCGWMKEFVMSESTGSASSDSGEGKVTAVNEDDSDPASPPAPPMKRRRKGKATTVPASSASASASASAASSTSKRGMKTRNANANANISVPEENTIASSLSAHVPIDFEEELRKELLNDQVMDGRISVRKFSSMAFVHCCAGHYHLLDSLRKILQQALEQGATVNLESGEQKRGVGPKGVDTDFASAGEQDEKEEKGESGEEEEGNDDAEDNNEEEGMDEDLDVDADVESVTITSLAASGLVSWTEIMCPGIIKWEARAFGSSTSKKAKKRKAASSLEIEVGGSLALSILSTRIVEIVQESGKLSGNFASKNGTEEYIQGIYDAFEGVPPRPSTGSASTTSTTKVSAYHELRTKRPNIYNLVVVVMRLVLMNHEQCLVDIAHSAEDNNSPFDMVSGEHLDVPGKGNKEATQGATGYVLINEEEVVKNSIAKEYAKYHPMIHKAIESLIKCVNFSHTSSSKNESKILYAIASAFAMKCSVVAQECEPPSRGRKSHSAGSKDVGNVVVVDSKLCSFALFHLSEIVDHIIKLTKQSFQGDEIDPGSKDFSANIIQTFLLDQPLIPDLEKHQAGLFTSSLRHAQTDFNVELCDEKGWRNGYFVGLFLRAMLPGRRRAIKSVASRTPLDLVLRLLSVVRACYAMEKNSSVLGLQGKRTLFTRCTLAADCFDAIRKCISHIPYHATISVGKAIMTVRLRAVFRKSIPARTAHSFIDLGKGLEDILIRQRLALYREDVNKNSITVVASTPICENGRLEYEQWERRLWNSQFKCCLSLVRGSARYLSRISNPSPTAKKSIFGTSTEKLALFKAVANKDISTDTKWPLYLPSSQHAIVCGILSCDPLPRTVKEASPEKFICEGIIQSIREALREPEETILKVDKVGKKQRLLQVSDEEVPFSLRDAHLFAVALNRTPKKEQISLTAKLVNVLNEDLLMIKEDNKLLSLLISERAYAAFLARALTVCSAIIDMVSSGKLLLENLCDHIGPLHYHLPSFIEMENTCETSQQDCISEGYKQDSCFMGLWPDWDLSSLPPVEVHTRIDPLPGNDMKHYRSLLDTALELGLQTATNDMCHLVFASWNASAKLCGIDNEVWKGPSTAIQMSAQSNAAKLISMRDDICQIFYELVDDESATPTSFLSSQLKRKRRRQIGSGRQGQGIPFLKLAVTESVQMLKNMSSLTIKNDALKSQPTDYVVMEATLSYISFLATMFTTSGTDLLTALVNRDRSRRKRKSSSFSGDSSINDNDMDDACSEDSGSDGYHDFDDDEDEEEAQLDGITRLQDLCSELGAAPFHPDWLDTNCRLRPGISETKGVEAAESMLQALTHLGREVFSRFEASLVDIISKCTTGDSKSEGQSKAVLSIMRGIKNKKEASDIATSGPSWQDDIAEAFNVDVAIIRAISQGLPCKNSDSAKVSFALTSAHRIKGKLHDFLAAENGWLPNTSEYLVGGEFELLLSDALISSCSALAIPRPPSDGVESMNTPSSNSTMFLDSELIDLCKDAQQWQRILRSSVSAMVTVNALLRFCLNGSKGRQQHQATHFVDTNTRTVTRPSYQTSPIREHFRDRFLSLSDMPSLQLKDTVKRALCFLAEINSCGFISHTIQKSAQAATSHLLVSDNDLLGIERVYAIRNSVAGLKDLSQAPHLPPGKVIQQVSDALVTSIGVSEQENGFHKQFLFCLRPTFQLRIGTVVETSTDLRSMLCKCGSGWNADSTEEIKFLVELIQGQHEKIAGVYVRQRITSLTINALETDIKSDKSDSDVIELRQYILKHWCSLPPTKIQHLVTRDICLNRSGDDCDLNDGDIETSRQICDLIVRMIGAVPVAETDLQNMLNSVIMALRGSMHCWVNDKRLSHVMCILCILAMRLGLVKDIAQELLRMIKEKERDEVKENLFVLELFYRFLEDTRKALKGQFVSDKKDHQANILLSTQSSSTGSYKSLVSFLPKTCSYLTTSGEFTEQHWYNCYTCGLTWDKGCCSLCVRVCHKGHDVGYSRKSSFFCDCGAEVKTNTGRISCKCLSTLSPSTLSSLNDKSAEASDSLRAANSSDNCIGVDKLNRDFWTKAVILTATHFNDSANASLEAFVKSIDGPLIEDLFGTFNSQFHSWANAQSTCVPSNDRESKNGASGSPNTATFVARKGSRLVLEKVESARFSPLRMSRTNVINTNILPDSSADKARKSLLTRNAIERRIVTADSRGRLIIAEPKSLLFCGALPSVNTRHVSQPLESGLLRSQLSILGSHKVDIGIVGLSLCPGRDRHLVTWGLTSACFHILNDGCDKIDSSIALTTGLDEVDGDCNYIVKVEWVTGTILAVFCSTTVKLYDLESKLSDTAGKVACHPSVTYMMACDDLQIRSGAIVPIVEALEDEEEDGGSVEQYDVVRRIMLLFDTGRMIYIDFALNHAGNLDDEGDVIVEYGEGVSFPVEGVRRFNGSSPEHAQSTSKSLGEGSCLVYLPRSKILLYKCISSAVVAFILNAHGDIVGNFEFLPHVIQSELVHRSDGDSMTGPYTNWTELGTVEDDPAFFRAAFVAHSTKTNQPHLIYIEYNIHGSKIRRLKMPNNVNLNLSMISSYEGLSAFSGPFISDSGTADGMLEKGAGLQERVYLVSLTSNGILTFHGEDLTDNHKSNTDSMTSISSIRKRILSSVERVKFKDTAKPLPSFPLTIFETLQNVTPSNALIFSGDGVTDNSASTKKKLSTGSTEYVISPSKDGCTFIASLQDQNQSKNSLNSTVRKSENLSKHVIVAVRILLGDFIPSHVAIMGRSIKSTRDKKRWFDVPLTDEEIILGVRAGFVSIFIGGSMEGDRSQIVIDSIEVYAEERSKLPRIFPICQHQAETARRNIRPTLQEDGTDNKSLDASIMIISHAINLSGVPGLLSTISEESLQRLIQVTALNPDKKGSVRNHVIELLKGLESDPHKMQMLLDKGTLLGISNVLKDLDLVVKGVTGSDGTTFDASLSSDLFENMLKKINECLTASIVIVRERPMNYKHAIDNLIESKSASSSIALHSTKFIENAKHHAGVVETSCKLVELIMHEILSKPGEQSINSVRSFADIDTLIEFLKSPNQTIVRNCCETIAKVLKDLPAEVMLHKCDCCGVLPISGRRYTIDEENMDIDLCQECYTKGIAYAASQDHDPEKPVRVDNKAIYMGGNKELSCDEISKMSSKIVPEEPIDAPTSVTLRALIFEKLLLSIKNDTSLPEHLDKSNIVPVLDVLLTLVLQCSRYEEKIELGEAMSEVLCKEILKLTKQSEDEQASAATIKKCRHAVVLYLRTLGCLITKQGKIPISTLTATAPESSLLKISFQASPTPASKSKTDPRFVCETHDVPAVRRRCSHGEHKDRRFYVCGMDRKNRCKYFKWADELDDTATEKGTSSAEHSVQQSELSDALEDIVIDSRLQPILWKQLNAGNPPLHKKLCTMVRNYVKKSKKDESPDGSNGQAEATPSITNVRKHLHSTLDSCNNRPESGNFLSINKLGSIDMPGGGETDSPASKSATLDSTEYLCVEASLDFLSQVATHSRDITQKTYASWEVWYSPLCHIISKEASVRLKSRAKKMLKCITGGRRTTYHQVRDRFVFASQFSDLLSYCEAPLQAALYIRQKARQCGLHWRQSNPTWETLSTGGLLGTQALVSEDNYTIVEMEKIIKVLDHLIVITKSRSDNWRHFCALDKLPQKDADLEISSTRQLNEGVDLNHRSPICLLIWMACSLPGSHQVKILQLIDIALQKPTGAGSLCYDESHGIMSTDVGTDADAEGVTGEKDTPEKVLLSGASGLSMDDICAFGSTFILNATNPQSRSHAKNILTSLFVQSSPDALRGYFDRMATSCMTEVGPSGKQGIEFLQFLTNIASIDVVKEQFSSGAAFLLQVAIFCFVKQTSINRSVINSSSNKNIFELKLKKDKMTQVQFDLTRCTYCENCTDAPMRSSADKTSKTESKWAEDQLSDYRRIHLDQNHAVSTEFSSFVQLKERLSISEIFLSVSDQRGRFAKTIDVYFSPRPVTDSTELKDEDYEPLWQKCGTISLPRAASKASCKLPDNVVAANLKFHYVDFYEKIAGGRTSSGAMVLHCPRCTRVVNNAHGGVCGHCGEVAFQCRKCRHINYDQLDAFLCVECGYCSSGMFSFELEAGEAISAVAIQDESDLHKSIVTLHAKNKRYSEVKNTFKKYTSYENTTAGSKRKRSSSGISDKLDNCSGPLKRALLGELPKITIYKGGSDKKKDSKRSGASTNRTSASTRARSLLSLARQLRGESSSDGDVRSSLGDILVQQARLSSGARGSFPFDDAEDEMIIQNTSGGGRTIPFDMQDPLSRLVANIQARARGETSPQRASESGERRSKKDNSSKAAEEGAKCYKQLRGLRRDCTEISKRIIAFKRLNQDALADHGYAMNTLNYSPTNCSTCSLPITHGLLELVHALLSCNIETTIDGTINENVDFISCLFDDQTTDADSLVKLKRSILVTISKTSTSGAKMILKELQVRLNGGRDPISAEILGSLLQNSVRNHDDFVKLAVKMLEA